LAKNNFPKTIKSNFALVFVLIVVLFVGIVDDRYGFAMSTPKMRQMKQLFVALWVFGNSYFFDGKKVEWAHLFGKILQTKHNNFKKFFKELVSKKAFNHLRFLYSTTTTTTTTTTTIRQSSSKKTTKCCISWND
jgi:UDP-N-acetylmuramyl pentapeptide phosphotransferase/UDP-N-acetylglucosamine-1-phosphate transferase